MSINIPKKIGFGEGGGKLPKLEKVLKDIAQKTESVEQALVSAVAGDLNFVIEPATVDTEIDAQNVGEFQVMDATIEGLVAAAGAGDIDVTITAEGMDNSPKTVSVAVGNNDTAEDIATKIKTALDSDADIGHVATGFFTITRDLAILTFTANLEAAQDATMAIAVEPDTAEFVEGTELDVTFEFSTDGVAPYERTVTVKLEDSEGNLHFWFSGTVPVTIGEVTAGDGVAEVVGGLNPEMVNGEMEVTVRLREDWADADTNTLTVSQKTILGEDVTAVTSEETSIDTV